MLIDLKLHYNKMNIRNGWNRS